MPENRDIAAAPGREAWLRALADFEASLGAAASGEDADWVEPGDLGPIPVDLEQRARDLVSGQSEMIAELRRARHVAATHLAALRTVPASNGAGASVYLDTSG
ncbi:MAG TPA: hypothetical protein VEX88_04825 [Glaciibacter sp.]|nr:hypothetical protein [Glaciibacter sp.]